jgi:tRNA threonylcarbamoyladenosine biosynthesis protein TsaE
VTAALRLALPAEDDTRAFGAALAAALPPQLVIHLRGDLGSGKTTLARALVQALEAGMRVKSPTYTLLETYATSGRTVHHLDLYRIGSPLELEALGLRDLEGVILIEWPERGGSAIPAADLVLGLAICGDGRELDAVASSAAGALALHAVAGTHPSEPD